MLPFILGFFWLLVIFSMLYMIMIFLFTFGWLRTKYFYQKDQKPLSNISIVVAVRNEEQHIVQLLKALAAQDYPKDKYEILIVNDHSEDNTSELVLQFKSSNKSVDIQLLKGVAEGKKAAIQAGIEHAGYDLIAMTDGDCSVGKLWLRRLAAFYEEYKPELISGPVVYSRKNGLTHHFFMLDFLGLVASGAGSLGIRLPLMANGANLMFAKKTYLDVLSQQDGKNRASGDDVFLLHAIVKKYGAKKVRFLKDMQAIVTTESPANFGQFFRQRVRWSSKATAYRSWWAVLVSVTVFLFNLFLFFSLLATVVKVWFLVIYLLFSLLKIVIDFPLLRYFSEFAGRKQSLRYLFLFGWIYPVYVVVAAVSSFFLSYSWKDRNDLR